MPCTATLPVEAAERNCRKHRISFSSVASGEPIIATAGGGAVGSALSAGRLLEGGSDNVLTHILGDWLILTPQLRAIYAQPLDCKGSTVMRVLRTDRFPRLVTIVATVFAGSADTIAVMVTAATGRAGAHKVKLPPCPSLEEWLSFYQRHRELNDAVGAFVVGPGLEASASEAHDGVTALQHTPPDEQRTAFEEVRAVAPESFGALANLFVPTPFPPDEKFLRKILTDLESASEAEAEDQGVTPTGFLASAEGQFFIRVWMPCFVMYRTYPAPLLRQAGDGDLDSLEKLLRLDKSVVADPRIAHHWHAIMQGEDFKTRKRMLDAISGKPKGKLDKKGIRLALSSLISQWARAMKCEITAPQITELFDRIEQLRSGHADTALPESKEAFAKAVQRNRDWPSLPRKGKTHPDK